LSVVCRDVCGGYEIVVVASIVVYNIWYKIR